MKTMSKKLMSYSSSAIKTFFYSGVQAFLSYPSLSFDFQHPLIRFIRHKPIDLGTLIGILKPSFAMSNEKHKKIANIFCDYVGECLLSHVNLYQSNTYSSISR